MVGRTLLGLIIALLLLGGCESLSPVGSFDDVAALVSDRTGRQISWDPVDGEGFDKDRAIDALLSHPLSANGVMTIALLNNRSLQAEYGKLGIAQADLVQAGLPPNPALDGAVEFSGGVATEWTVTGALKVIEILYIPMKKRVAESKLEAAKLDVAEQVLTLAAETQCAFVDYLARQQRVGILNDAVESMRAAVAAAKSLRDAGNITALAFETQTAELVREELGLGGAKTRAARARERLNVLMGLERPDISWRAANRLPDVPGREVSTDNAEERALNASLELATAEQKLVTLAKGLRLQKARSLVPDFRAAGEWKWDEGQQEGKIKLGTTVPLFDWGQARKAKIRMEILQGQNSYLALATKITSAARNLRGELLEARKKALYHKSTALPQSERLLREAQRQYNAMQVDVFRLIRTKRDQIEVGERHVDALSTYWIAKARFMQLIKGTMPSGDAASAACAAPSFEN